MLSKAMFTLPTRRKAGSAQIDEITGSPSGILDYRERRQVGLYEQMVGSDRSQAVVDHFKEPHSVCAVRREDAEAHTSPALDGVIDLVGKTDMRQVVRLMYHAHGTVCPVTMYTWRQR